MNDTSPLRSETGADLENIFSTAHRLLKPRTPLPQISVKYFPFAGINHTARLNDGRLSIRVSDIFVDAPSDVHHTLAIILLAKLYRKPIDADYHRRYRLFILQDTIQERAREARSARGRRRHTPGPAGRYVDLNTSFDRINAHYFGSALEKPRLSWSTKRARSILGRYDATHGTIFISRLFDSRTVPSYVLDYVMFHEMLHVKHQSRVDDCRILVHTPEFREDERRFAFYVEAKDWLKSL